MVWGGSPICRQPHRVPPAPTMGFSGYFRSHISVNRHPMGQPQKHTPPFSLDWFCSNANRQNRGPFFQDHSQGAKSGNDVWCPDIAGQVSFWQGKEANWPREIHSIVLLGVFLQRSLYSFLYPLVSVIPIGCPFFTHAFDPRSNFRAFAASSLGLLVEGHALCHCSLLHLSFLQHFASSMTGKIVFAQDSSSAVHSFPWVTHTEPHLWRRLRMNWDWLGLYLELPRPNSKNPVESLCRAPDTNNHR